jgi:hypothetical protein
MTDSDLDYRRAFNAGSDARIRGLPVTANPFTATGGHGLHEQWRFGWAHVDREWGRDAKWPVPQLMPVEEAYV